MECPHIPLPEGCVIVLQKCHYALLVKNLYSVYSPIREGLFLTEECYYYREKRTIIEAKKEHSL